jgi:hypothetical protein
MVKGATPMNGHFLKLQLSMFEKSQGKYNSLDYNIYFWNAAH